MFNTKSVKVNHCLLVYHAAGYESEITTRPESQTNAIDRILTLF